MKIIVVSLLLLGCTTAKLLSSWTAPVTGTTYFQKILVVGVLQKEDSALGALMEDHLTGDLQSLGYDAVAFHHSYSAGAFRYLRYDSVQQRLLRRGFDGVVTIRLISKDSQEVYVSGQATRRPEGPPLGNFWDTPRRQMADGFGKPGYYVTTTDYFWESSFYELATMKLLYAAQTGVFDVSSAHSLAHRYGRLIATDMEKNYVLLARH